jgi:hypothetical protein
VRKQVEETRSVLVGKPDADDENWKACAEFRLTARDDPGNRKGAGGFRRSPELLPDLIHESGNQAARCASGAGDRTARTGDARAGCGEPVKPEERGKRKEKKAGLRAD